MLSRSGETVRRLNDPGFQEVAAAFGANGLFAVAGYTGDEHVPGNWRVDIWDVERGEIVREIDTYTESLAFDLHDPLLLTDDGGRPMLWEATTGARVGPLPRSVGPWAFSADGSVLALASASRVRLFDPGSGRLEMTLRGHACPVARLAFSPDGSLLATQACDGVRIWVLDLDELLRIAEANVTRALTDEECHRFLRVPSCADA
jgi:WD40 repeat protein